MCTTLSRKIFEVTKSFRLLECAELSTKFPKKYSHDGDAFGKVTEISDFTLGDFSNANDKVSHGRQGDFSNPDDKLSLVRLRYVTVNKFMNRVLVDVREYFEKDGVLKPGSRGVSLRYYEWKKLKEHIDLIDQKVESLKKQTEGGE